MANQKNQLVSIPLNSTLNLDKIKDKVAPYKGFNECNGAMFGSNLSPMYKSIKEKYGRPHIVFDEKDGVTSKRLYNSDNTESIDISTQLDNVLKREKFSIEDVRDEDILYIKNDNTYLYKKNEKIFYHYGSKEREVLGDKNQFEQAIFREDYLIIAFTEVNTLYVKVIKDDIECQVEIMSSTIPDKKAILGTYAQYVGDTLKILINARYVKINTNEKGFLSFVAMYHQFNAEGETPQNYFLFDSSTNTISEFEISWPSIREGGDGHGSISPFEYFITNDHDINNKNVVVVPASARSWRASRTSVYGSTFRQIGTINKINISLADLTVTNEYDTRLVEVRPEEEDEFKNLADGEIVFKRGGPADTNFEDYELDIILGSKCLKSNSAMSTALSVPESPVGSKKPIGTISKNGKTFIVYELYFNNTLLNISVGDETYATKLLLDGEIDPTYKVYCEGSYIYYFAVNKGWQKISLQTCTKENKEDYIFYIGKNLVIRTPLYENYFDKELIDYHYGTDWNNRITQRVLYFYSNFDKPGETYTIGAGSNILLNSNDPRPSSSAYPICRICKRLIDFDQTRILAKERLDIFISDRKNFEDDIPNLDARYAASLYKNTFYVNQSSLGKSYLPTSYNPGIFAKLVSTDFNKIFFKDFNTLYISRQFNGKNMLIYGLGSIIDEKTIIFSIQGQDYISDGNYIYIAKQTGEYFQIGAALVKVEGLIFCGAVPEMAIFYSPMNKTLLQFTANNILSVYSSATEISNIYFTKYNPQTFSSYLATDNGLYIISQVNTFKLPIYNITDIYFNGKTIYIENDEGSYAYYYTQEPDSKVIDLSLKTLYYGQATNAIDITDCIYIRLYSDNIEEIKYISLSATLLNADTEKSTSQKIEITPKMWDQDTHTYLVRFQPSIQRACGFSLGIKTDCDIASIDYSISQIDTYNSNNIKIKF